MTDAGAQPPDIDGSDMLDEDPCRLAPNHDLRTERRWTCAARCRRDEHRRSWQELLSLYDDAEPCAALLVSVLLRDLESVHVTPMHEETP